MSTQPRSGSATRIDLDATRTHEAPAARPSSRLADALEDAARDPGPSLHTHSPRKAAPAAVVPLSAPAPVNPRSTATSAPAGRLEPRRGSASGLPMLAAGLGLGLLVGGGLLLAAIKAVQPPAVTRPAAPRGSADFAPPPITPGTRRAEVRWPGLDQVTLYREPGELDRLWVAARCQAGAFELESSRWHPVGDDTVVRVPSGTAVEVVAEDWRVAGVRIPGELHPGIWWVQANGISPR
jgi:hypothetical protein